MAKYALVGSNVKPGDLPPESFHSVEEWTALLSQTAARTQPAGGHYGLARVKSALRSDPNRKYSGPLPQPTGLRRVQAALARQANCRA
jgi:hypothetical protein